MGCWFSKTTSNSPLILSENIDVVDNWDYIVWSGGSSNGIVYVGAYKALYDAHLLGDLKGAAGTSIGSLFALLCVLNFDPQQLYSEIMTLDIKQLADDSWCPLEDFTSIVNNWGLCRGNFLEKWVESLLKKATGVDKITFADLYARTKRHLKVTVFNETLVRTEYWDHTTRPDTPVSLGIRASCSMPLFYEPVHYDNDIFIDGGVGDVYPLETFGNNDATLGIMVMGSNETNTPDLVKRQDPQNLEDHVVAVYTCMATVLFRLQHPNWISNTIALGGPGKHQWDYNFTPEEKRDYINSGYELTSAALRLYNRTGKFSS